ncbi:MAG: TonB-dependent receptor [Melioribacter sp.]|nr:TonB-dependent receptor [Melioribacter sp.]
MKNLLLISAFFFANLLSAQTDTLKTTLSEIVVTANRTETPYYSLGSSVTIISAEQINAKHYNTVVDILRDVPGLTIVQQGGPGKIANLFMRGANSNHTLVFIDGVKMNDASSPNNAYDFSILNVNDIEKIEIVRGPQSTLYGSDAVAGVINIITKAYSQKQKYSLNAEGGSNSFYRGNILLTGSYKLVSYLLSASGMGSKGISASSSKYGNNETDKFSNNSITSKINFNFLENLSLNLIYKYTKLKTDIDQNDKHGDDPNYTYDAKEQMFRGEIKSRLLNNAFVSSLSASFVERNSSSVDEIDDVRPYTSSNSSYNSNRIKFDWQNNLHFIKGNLISFGIETELEKADSRYFSNSQWGPYESVFPEKSIRTTGFYIQDQISIKNSLFSSIGFRIDNNEKYGTVTTYRIAPAYFFSKTNTKIKFSYGTGFKAPSLYYLFDPMFGNPELKPEKSIGWDVGIEQFLMNGNLSFGITYFNLSLKDMFGYDANFKTINIAKASSKGMEVYIALDNFSGIFMNANYTFNKTKDEYEKSNDYNKSLLRRPEHQFYVNLGYNIKKLTLSTSVKYVGKRDDKDFSTYPVTRVTLKDYSIVNLNVEFKLLPYLNIYGKIDNLFNTEYEEVLYYGTLGRTFYIGLNVKI